MIRRTLTALLLCLSASAFALPFSSQHVLVYEEETGKILLEKNASTVVPIASLTKVMTAMVVLDAGLDMDEPIRITETDVDTLKFSSSRVPVGVVLTRKSLLELSLMSSDNRAAAALGRTFPGGHAGFREAVRRKAGELGMRDTYIEEPTGLSPNNRSSALDLLRMVAAASAYPEISRMSTGLGEMMDMNGRTVEYRNTNRLIGRDGWDILLSKTGFTREAGRCLVMRFQSAGRHVIVVLLNASESAARMLDAENVQRYLNGESPVAAAPRAAPQARAAKPAVVRVSNGKKPNKPQQQTKRRTST
ncbi:MAG TPA: serine hydrolase [Noviherbaspirillum sp.]|nr:serine hydrolase [Noviherbaspirillum sp.]